MGYSNQCNSFLPLIHRNNIKTMDKIFAIIDANNFYASCERVFNPALKNTPIVILSSNDGCVIARSNEAKALGIKMGEPFFKLHSLIKSHNVKAISSNFALYGDMSRRMMSILEEFSPACEEYSIDECFLDFSHLTSEQIQSQCQCVRNRVKKWLGIPISIGIGSTKTLAKLAVNVAKTRNDGSYHIATNEHRLEVLKLTDVEDIWGIGTSYSSKLKAIDINSALDLANCPDALIKKQTNILGVKTAHELRGISCIDLIEQPDPKQSITVSRSFGNEIRDFQTLKQALSFFTSRAAEKLRKSGQMTKSISIFIRTNPFSKTTKQYKNSVNIILNYPTSSTPVLLSSINRALADIYQPGYSYKKAGILISDFCPKTTQAFDLFDKPLLRESSSKLMNVIDKINYNYGKRAVFYASCGITQEWLPKSNMKSPSYTSNWNELIKAI